VPTDEVSHPLYIWDELQTHRPAIQDCSLIFVMTAWSFVLSDPNSGEALKCFEDNFYTFFFVKISFFCVFVPTFGTKPVGWLLAGTWWRHYFALIDKPEYIADEPEPSPRVRDHTVWHLVREKLRKQVHRMKLQPFFFLSAHLPFFQDLS
jgi:hypothetical protein